MELLITLVPTSRRYTSWSSALLRAVVRFDKRRTLTRIRCFVRVIGMLIGCWSVRERPIRTSFTVELLALRIPAALPSLRILAAMGTFMLSYAGHNKRIVRKSGRDIRATFATATNRMSCGANDVLHAFIALGCANMRIRAAGKPLCA